MCFVSNIAFSAPCDTPLSSAQEAIACVNHKFKNDAGLYKFAKDSNHLGDVGDNLNPCKSNLGDDTYFSADQKEFNNAVININITACQDNTINPGTYRCIGRTPGPACYREKIPTNNVAAVIIKANAKFASFHPTK